MDARWARARCWLEVDLDRIEENYRTARRICGEGVQIIPVLKANAYGLGAAKLSRTLSGLGARLFAVAEMNEALEVRRACGGDVLVLGRIDPVQMEQAVREGVIATVYEGGQACRLDHAAKIAGVTARAFFKVDTGLHRLGFDSQDIDGLLQAFDLPNIRCEGLFTHLALRNPLDDAAQIARFHAVAEHLQAAGRDCGLLHVCDSIGMVRYPQWRFDAVRIGAWLYGVKPSGYADLNGDCRLPVRWMTRVAQVRMVRRGECLGYDDANPLPEDRRIATLSAGYADGYPRVNSRGAVSVRGALAPVVGLTCMDQMTVDVTEVPGVQPGDEVALLGDGISLEAYSASTGAHRNEALCRIGRRVPRVYVRGGTVEEVVQG